MWILHGRSVEKMGRVREHCERGGRVSVETQTCVEVEVTVGVVSMETKGEGEWRILLSLLLPAWSKVWCPLYCCDKECFSGPKVWRKKLDLSHRSIDYEATANKVQMFLILKPAKVTHSHITLICVIVPKSCLSTCSNFRVCFFFLLREATFSPCGVASDLHTSHFF